MSRPPLPPFTEATVIQTFAGDRIAVRFAYEYRDDSGHWFRAYGNENWHFDADGLMTARFASINEHPITEAERYFRWPLGRRPDGHPGLSDLHPGLLAVSSPIRSRLLKPVPTS
jgi:nuclear transport factor 2 (NTF2) superfamily protein